jgi:O-antigen biosynthesis protein
MNSGLKISVIIPTFNPVIKWLEEAIQSVLNQSFINWELCIADDASTDDKVKITLKTYTAIDSRIKVRFREINGHISEASNSALELVTGEWIVLMDHDDILPPYALKEIANVIRDDPDAQLIYSDEDKIDEEGNRFCPHFKTDWNPDLFTSCNLISHLAAYRTSVVMDMGGFRVGYEGAQDFDFTWRYIDRINSSKIKHLAMVLYHWRAHKLSTAFSGESKPYVVNAGKSAIDEHLMRIGSSARSNPDQFGWYRTKYPLPDRRVLVSAIILSGGDHDHLQRYIEGIKSDNGLLFWEFLVLPTTSRAERLLKEEKLPPEAHLIEWREYESLASVLNRASLNAGGEILWYVHDRLEVDNEGSIEELISHTVRPEIGAVGGILLYPDKRVRQAGLLLDIERVSCPAFHHWSGNSPGYMGRLTLMQNYSAVSKDCLMIEKKKFLEVGGFDEGNLKSHHLDVDLCMRLKDAGYRTLWTPYARFQDSRSRFSVSAILDRFSQDYQQDRQFMQKRWGDILENDPAYNPNLNQKKKDFSYKLPPKQNG